MIARKLGDRYRLDKRLGGGGQGEVFLGFDEKISRPVAIKLLKTSDYDSAAQRQALLQEAIATAKFEHVNVVRIFDFQVTEDGLPFLVMEYLEGPTGDDLPLPLDPALLALLVKNVCAALKKAHKQELVHRDLKPGNLMLVDHGTPDQRFVLLDLGIAKLTERDKLQVEATHSGAGTPMYMSPEQINGESGDFRSDVYSFGTMLFELLTGRCPFGSKDTPSFAMQKAVCSQRPPTLKETCPQGRFDKALETLVRECLEKDPERRPQSMEEVAKRFQNAMDFRDRKPPSSKLRLWVISALLLSFVAGFEIYRNPATNGWLLSIFNRPARLPDETVVVPPISPDPSTSSQKPPPVTSPKLSVAPPPSELERITDREIPSVSEVHQKPSVGPILEQDVEKPFPNSIGMTLVRIQPGSFLMGSTNTDPHAIARERPQHKVTFEQPFCMGVFEVTQAEYQQVRGVNPSHFQGANVNGERANRFPVEQVSWNEAREFCEILSNRPAEKAAGRLYRLPTEAEWEYACRAGSITPFPKGDEFSPEFAWFNQDRPARVGSRLPNAWGLYDMQGNVWELCADFFDDRYYLNSLEINPQGPATAHLAEKLPGNENDELTGNERVMRGRGFEDNETKLFRFAYRTYLDPSSTDKSIGFRIVCDMPARKSP